MKLQYSGEKKFTDDHNSRLDATEGGKLDETKDIIIEFMQTEVHRDIKEKRKEKKNPTQEHKETMEYM